MWITFAVFAAFMQAWRNAFQSQLGGSVSVAGVTLARFLWASPLALLYLAGLHYWQPQPVPEFNQAFWFYSLGAACFQILATGLMVVLFKQNNYAVGAGLAKSEAIVAAILGVIFFATELTPLGWTGVLLGGLAVFMLSSMGKLSQVSPTTLLLGLSCGIAFALTSLWVREASLLLETPFPHRAAWVLTVVLIMQTVLLSLWVFCKERQTFTLLRKHYKLTLAISLSSCLGSIGWFSAMSLQAVAYVKTIGQIEVFFTMLISAFWLRQKVNKKHFGGLLLIAIAAVLVMWA